MPLSLEQSIARCMKKVEKTEGDCWLWTGKVDKDGRPPRMTVKGKQIQRSRVVYFGERGE